MKKFIKLISYLLYFNENESKRKNKIDTNKLFLNCLFDFRSRY